MTNAEKWDQLQLALQREQIARSASGETLPPSPLLETPYAGYAPDVSNSSAPYEPKNLGEVLGMMSIIGVRNIPPEVIAKANEEAKQKDK